MCSFGPKSRGNPLDYFSSSKKLVKFLDSWSAHPHFQSAAAPKAGKLLGMKDKTTRFH